MNKIVNPLDSSEICNKCPVKRSCVTKERIPSCAGQFFYDEHGRNNIDWNAVLKIKEEKFTCVEQLKQAIALVLSGAEKARLCETDTDYLKALLNEIEQRACV